MSIARKKYDEHLQWLRELANKEKLQFSDVLRAVIKAPSGKYRLADLAYPEHAENRLIELGRVEYYERIFDDLMKVTNSDIERMAENRIEEMRSQAARQAAISRHSQPGGSHDKQKKMQEVWATGKYSSRTKCAVKEHENLGMSLSTAQKALRNTPDPKNRATARKG